MAAKILIVDDEADLLMMSVGRLQKAGYDVVTAADGQSGLEMVASEKPDLVLLDLVMPGLDGYEVCRRLKADEKTKHIPVILFTARFAITPLDETARALRAEDYVPKPFDAKELVLKVQRLLDKKKP
jgi:CheY-like chemotaxis protein